MKTLIVLQFYEGDKAQARRLTELMTWLETSKVESAGVLLAPRFDCCAEDEWVGQVARRFDVDVHVGRRRAYGWPFGPNELWYDTTQWIYESELFRRYDTALFMEPDAVPLVPGWIPELQAAWRAAERPCVVMGHLHEYAAGRPHVNGNAMFSLDKSFLWSVVRKHGGNPAVGWDVEFAPIFFQQGARNTPLIRNLYAHPTIGKAEFEAQIMNGCVFLHGVKDLSVQQLVRERVTQLRRA